MSLRAKLSFGLGFLFLIIFALVLYSSVNIQKLTRDADRILSDNYASLVYSKNMLVALDDMNVSMGSLILGHNETKQASYAQQTFESSRGAFETNLLAESHNVTELHEQDYVNDLVTAFGSYLDLYSQVVKTGGGALQYFDEMQPAYSRVRQSIISIDDVNMQAIERKNQTAHQEGMGMITAMGIVGAICILLAFGYFLYFPFYISNTASFLASKMSDLLGELRIKMDTQTKDEAFVLLHGINLIEARFSREGKSGNGTVTETPSPQSEDQV